MSETSIWILLSKIIGVLSFCMFLYAIYSGRVYGRSWKKYLGGWIYKIENQNVFSLYVAMYFVIFVFSFLCLILF